MGWWARAESTWRALRRGAELDAGMHDEMRFHIDMETERLVRERGLSQREAFRQARIAFGGLEQHKEEARDVRGLQWLGAVSLDARLAVRMLVKHRGLTLVGGFAMAVAIAIGAGFFEIVTEVLEPGLPVPEGARMVSVQIATSTPGSAERRVLHYFASWRRQLKSFEQLGAFRNTRRNLVTSRPPYESIRVSEITASGFAVAGAVPLLGRPLLPADEGDGSAPVVVIGYRAWRSRFDADPHIVGRTINLGGTSHTIVGVMPDAFRFPVDHQYWVPLRVDPVKYGPWQGPEVVVFGRLGRGVTLGQAQAELTAFAQRSATATDTSRRLRPQVLPYTRELSSVTDSSWSWLLWVAQVFVSALTFVVAANLAILMYARTVTRMGEIAVRTALGASRHRILGQLFVEAFALSLVGAGCGLVIAQFGLGRLKWIVQTYGTLPFWLDLSLSARTILYAFGLALVAAVIMGVLPGLKATGKRVNVSLRQVDFRAGAQLGPTWTVLVVTQVAVAVAALPLAVYLAWQVVQTGFARPPVAASQMAVALVVVGNGEAAEAERVRDRQVDLTARLEAQPGASGVAFSSGVPGFGELGRDIEFEPNAGAKSPGAVGVCSLEVGPDLFDIYEARILAGRALTAADSNGANSVVVNHTFVQRFLTGSPLNAQFRYVAPHERPGTRPGTTYHIVGVVSDFPGLPPYPGSSAPPVVYHASAPGAVHPFALSVRFKGGVPSDVRNRFQIAGGQAGQDVQMRVASLPDFYPQVRALWSYLAWAVALVTTSVLLLSAAGMYALMSFTVARRTREIAIRAALGAAPHRLLLGILGRATAQLTTGVLVGSLLAAGVLQTIDLGTARVVTSVLAVGGAMLFIGLTAALGPARRGLRIQASEALRTDG
jgi:putative ABC transport system permease protein